MVELARHHGDGPLSLADVAMHEELPRPYLEQLVVNLRAAGLVSSTRGAHGGYELARSPDTIRLGEVLRALEGPIVPMVCASDLPEHITCNRTTFCSVSVLWVRVRDAINTAVDSLTLADLVAQHVPAPAVSVASAGA
jgi:Rrf2 family cysteine metabolism transcriptional repressor